MRLLQFFRNLGLGVKAIIVVVLAFLLLQVVVASVGRAAVGRLIVQVGQNRAEQEAAVIQNRFEKAEQDILASTKLLASRTRLIEAVASQDATMVRTAALVGAAPLDLDGIDVVGPDGTYIATILGAGGTLHAAQQAPLISLSLLGIETTGVILDEEEAALWLAAAVPLRDTSGAIIGVLLTSRRADEGFLEERNFYRSDVHIALIAGGRILAKDFPTPELPGEFSVALLDETAIGQALSGQTIIADDLLSVSGTPYALAHTPLVVGDDTVATIGIAVDLGALSIFQRQLLTTIAITFITLGVVILAGVALFVRYGISLPIGRLMSVVKDMASGDYGRRAGVTRGDEIGQLAAGFNVMAARLQETLENLEQRGVVLQRRSLQMQASADVGRAATSILEPDRLIQHAVDLIRERFGLYYVGLFLVDETGGWAVLRAGTGEAGRALLARGHRIRVGEGMVGWSISHAEARIAEEAGVDAVRLAAPELPDTRSEAALALRSRGRVLGALTVQSDRPGAFDEQSVTVLQTLADQVAVAIDNAGLFAESQAALEAARRAYGELSRQAWADLLHARSITGYHYGVEQGHVTQLSGDRKRTEEPAEGLPEVELPIKVHGAVIGTIIAHKPADADEWQHDEVTMLEELADQLGIAMESARLYQDTQRRAARERLVGEIADRLQRAPDMEMLLQIAAQELNQALGGSRAYVRMGVGGRENEPDDGAGSGSA